MALTILLAYQNTQCEKLTDLSLIQQHNLPMTSNSFLISILLITHALLLQGQNSSVSRQFGSIDSLITREQRNNLSLELKEILEDDEISELVKLFELSRKLERVDASLSLKLSSELIDRSQVMDNDTLIVNGLCHKANAYKILSNYDSAAIVVKEAINLSNKIQFKFGQGQSHLVLAAIEQAQGKYKDGLQNAMQAIEYCQEQSCLAAALNNAGICHYGLGDYGNAVEYYTKGLKEYEEQGDINGQLLPVYNIAACHYYLGQEEKTLEYCDKALLILDEVKNVDINAGVYNIQGAVLFQQKEFSKAAISFQSSVDLYKSVGNVAGIGATLPNIASCFAELGLVERSIEKNLEALALNKENNLIHGQVLAHVSLADGYSRSNKYNSALYHLDQGYTIAESIENKDYLKQILQSQSLTYEQIGNYKNALEKQKALSVVKDSIYSKEQVQRILDVEAKYETEKAALENEKLSADLKLESAKSSQRTYMLLGAAGLFLITLLFLRSLSRKNKKLDAQNIALDEEKSLVTKLKKEQSHRFSNNLGSLATITNIKSSANKNSQESNFLRDNTTKLETVQHLNRLLQFDSSASIAIDMKALLIKIVETFKSLYADSSDDKITYHLELEEILLDADIASNLALAFNEILTNVYKHAFDNTSNPTIHIVLIKHEKEIALSVKDNGIGFKTTHISPDSNGISIINALVANARGTFQYLAEEGTQAIIKIPLSKNDLSISKNQAVM